MATLDVIMSRNRNKRKLEKALEAEFERDPIRFFKSILMPLMPREAKVACEHGGVVRWQTLLGATVTKADIEGRRKLSAGHRGAGGTLRLPAAGVGSSEQGAVGSGTAGDGLPTPEARLPTGGGSGSGGGARSESAALPLSDGLGVV